MNILSTALLILGVVFFFVAAVGAVRLPDTFSRMHAASKGSSLGLLLALSACGLTFGTLSVVLKTLVILLAVFVTLPVATHLLASASIDDEQRAMLERDD